MNSRVAASSGPRSILLVDDIELNRTLTQAVLVGAGYEVDCVEDGATAIRAVEAKAYDLVLMDLDMPGIDGFQATAAIRERVDPPPVVALTSRTGMRERARARELGMAAHLGRPFAPRVLLRAVDDLIDAHSGSASQTFRPEVQQEIVTRLGADRTRMFVEILLEQCRIVQELIAAAGGFVGAVERKVHDLASTAGMLGYEELWHRCRDLLVAPDDVARTRAVPPVSAALARAITAIERQLATTEDQNRTETTAAA